MRSGADAPDRVNEPCLIHDIPLVSEMIIKKASSRIFSKKWKNTAMLSISLCLHLDISKRFYDCHRDHFQELKRRFIILRTHR